MEQALQPLTRTRYVFTLDSQLQQTTTKFLDRGSVELQETK